MASMDGSGSRLPSTQSREGPPPEAGCDRESDDSSPDRPVEGSGAERSFRRVLRFRTIGGFGQWDDLRGSEVS